MGNDYRQEGRFFSLCGYKKLWKDELNTSYQQGLWNGMNGWEITQDIADK
jgi:hypothetical protein